MQQRSNGGIQLTAKRAAAPHTGVHAGIIIYSITMQGCPESGYTPHWRAGTPPAKSAATSHTGVQGPPPVKMTRLDTKSAATAPSKMVSTFPSSSSYRTIN